MLAIASLVLVIGYWQGSEEESDDLTDGWETYVNEEYGYKIKHPRDWSSLQLGKTIIMAPHDIIKGIKEIKGGFGGGDFLTTTIHIYDEPLSRQSDEHRKVIQESIIIDNVKGVKYSTINQDSYGMNVKGDLHISIVLPIQDKYINISLEDEQYLEIFNQMLDSFKFLD